jgi:aminopeptidase Y
VPGGEAADFAGFPAGIVALVSRGVCAFAIKATNAFNAGASGVIVAGAHVDSVKAGPGIQ